MGQSEIQNPKSKIQTVVVIGGGPAGLTAAYELIRAGLKPIVLEMGARVGGIARTEVFDGYRLDIGGHRFFTKVPEVEAFWYEVLGEDFLTRPRLSRIYYNRKFILYPLRFETLAIIYKRSDLTKTEHYAPAHIKHKTALFKKQPSSLVIPFIIEVLEKQTKTTQQIKDAVTEELGESND